ncbi:MAG: hypothetical protein ACRDRI_24195 [Pseudonocardiaceae bacterium]
MAEVIALGHLANSASALLPVSNLTNLTGTTLWAGVGRTARSEHRANLTYVGSLATLLWRRVLADNDAAPTLREFVQLGALTVPTCLAVSTVALWLALTVERGWLS